MLFTTNLVGRTEMRSAGFYFYMCHNSHPGEQKEPRLNSEDTAQKNKRQFHRSEKSLIFCYTLSDIMCTILHVNIPYRV